MKTSKNDKDQTTPNNMLKLLKYIKSIPVSRGPSPGRRFVPVIGYKMKKYKYPKTWFVPQSRSIDDHKRVLSDLSCFEGKDVVITEKLDGENTTMYSDFIHARSLDSKDHPSRHWIKAMHAAIKFSIPEGIRICGENMYATHSIHYIDLLSYFYIFSVWDSDTCLSWEDTEEWARYLGFPTVPLLYIGEFNLEKFESIVDSLDTEKQEGVVIRNAYSFSIEDFNSNVAKWVRPKHIQTNEHWMNKEVIPNELNK